MNCQEQPRIYLTFFYESVLAFGVFLTNSCSISEYILVNPDGILAIFVRFKPNAADPAQQS